MNRTTVAVIATLITLVFVVGTSWAGFSLAPNLLQDDRLDVDIWLSQIGSTDPIRRLDPGVSQAQVVIRSNLRDTDPDDFRIELVDANGIRIFQSETLMLPTGSHTRMVEISGREVFSGYVSHVESWRTRLKDEVGAALLSAQEDNPSAGQVRNGIDDALAAGQFLGNGVERLRAFDLSADGGAASAFQATETALTQVSNRLTEARGLLDADDIDWNAVQSKLQTAQTAANDATNQAQTGLDALTDRSRNFPPTGVAGRCNQNTAQLRIAGSGTISGDFWWTVGTPGAPARLTNPQDPATTGNLLAQYAQIYAMTVNVAGARHSTDVEALMLDALCLPVPSASVDFSASANPVVTLQSSQATTNANGIAKVTVNATNELGDNGTATVRATVNGSVTASTDLTIIGPPHRLSLRLGGSENLRIPNYGVESTVQISAVLKDKNLNDVADGTPVRFTIDPPDHSFPDSGQVTTAGGQASAILILGSATGFYEIKAISGDVNNSQLIRVVGYPATIQVEANPDRIQVNTPIVDQRSSTLRVKVQDDEGQPAPDGTLVEFVVNSSGPDSDADYVYFPTLSQVDRGRYATSIVDGEVSATLVGNQALYRRVQIQVKATYSVNNEVRGSASTTVPILLHSGEVTFLPLIKK
jgi:hypothetical protein